MGRSVFVAGVPQPEKSGDKGVDGKVYFGDADGKLGWAVCQVKAVTSPQRSA